MYCNPKTGKYEKRFHFELKYDTFVGKPKPEVIRQFKEDAYVKEGIVRWSKSNNIPPKDFLYDWADLGLIKHSDIEVNEEQRSVDTTAFLDDYIKRQERFKKEDPEGWEESRREMAFEARAAYGPGERVTNIITGDSFIT